LLPAKVRLAYTKAYRTLETWAKFKHVVGFEPEMPVLGYCVPYTCIY
jgi:hypothetical protein